MEPWIQVQILPDFLLALCIHFMEILSSTTKEIAIENLLSSASN